MREDLNHQDQFVDAAFRGDIPNLMKLLAAGANLDEDGTNWNPLHAAVENTNEAAVRFLLVAGADPNRTCGGATALHHAIDIEIDSVNQRLQRTPRSEELPEPFITRLLLEHGANPSIRDSTGETPYDFAFRRGHLHAASLLRDWFSRPVHSSNSQ